MGVVALQTGFQGGQIFYIQGTPEERELSFLSLHPLPGHQAIHNTRTSMKDSCVSAYNIIQLSQMYCGQQQCRSYAQNKTVSTCKGSQSSLWHLWLQPFECICKGGHCSASSIIQANLLVAGALVILACEGKQSGDQDLVALHILLALTTRESRIGLGLGKTYVAE